MGSVCVDSSHGLVGESPPICQIRRQIERLGRSRSPVLLLGESGTGKEVVARAIHNYLNKKRSSKHCAIGYVAACLSFMALLTGLLMLGGYANLGNIGLVAGSKNVQVPASNVLSEVEAKEFLGISLTPMSKQNNNAINGTQYINKSTYVLHVTGLVENDLNLSYGQLLALPAYSEVADLPCVEGWTFTAQWTGFRVSDLLNLAGLDPNAAYVVFYGADGYSTGLPLDYLRSQQTLLAYGINNVTLPPNAAFHSSLLQ